MNIFFILVLFMYCTAMLSMEQSEQSSVEDKKICYLALVPVEIRNKIARYLIVRESKDECIERIEKSEKIIPPRYWDALNVLSSSPSVWGEESYGTYGTITGHSADVSQIIFVQRPYRGNQHMPKVTICDTKTDTMVKSKRLTELTKEDMCSLKAVALSQDRTLFAQLWIKSVVDESRSFYKGKIKITNINTNVVRGINIKSSYIGWDIDYKVEIGFNLQATKLIIIEQTKKDKKYIEMSQIINIYSQEERQEQRLKRFDNYFMQHYICKSIINNLLQKITFKSNL